MYNRRKNKDSGVDDWVVTYGDMLSLLLVFFILLYAISSVNEGKFRKVSEKLSKAFGGSESVISNTSGGGDNILDLETIIQELNKQIRTLNLQDDIDVVNNGKDIVIRGKGDTFFASGNANLTDKIKEFLDLLAPIIKTTNNDIEVDGHTDDIPIKSDKFPSNWELSSARAASVVRYLIDTQKINPFRFTTKGFAEFKPLYPMIPANRSKNRRIEIQ